MVAMPPDDSSDGRPDRSLAEQLVEQARTDGIDLVGPGGLLAGLTKQVLEAGLRSRWRNISATRSMRSRVATWPTRAKVPAPRRCSPRSARSRLRCRGIVIGEHLCALVLTGADGSKGQFPDPDLVAPRDVGSADRLHQPRLGDVTRLLGIAEGLVPLAIRTRRPGYRTSR